MKHMQPNIDLPACVVAAIWCPVLALIIVLQPANGEPVAPASALNAGTGTHAPASSFQAPVAPSVNQPSALQSANLPADFARMNDNAIIIIDGKPTTAGEVKRIVRGLDDAAIIIIGGMPAAAGDVKRQLAAASAQQKVDSRVA